MKHLRKALPLALLLLAVFVMAACATTPAATPADEPAAAETGSEAAEAPEAAPAESGSKVAIFGLYQEPELLNPLIRTQTAANDVGGFVGEGLLGVDPEGNFFPALAAEVPSTENGLISDDSLVVTYPLKEGIVWSDGEPFTCDDVVYTWEVATNPDSGSVNTTGFNEIASIECPDDYTAVMTYSEFFGPFLSTWDFVIPRHATGDPLDMQNWAYNRDGFIGTGPFKVQEWISGDRIVLAKNENYRGMPDEPKLDSVIVRIIPSREVGKALITSGEIDFLWDLTEADVPEFEDNPNVVVNNKPGPGTERLLLNLGDPTIDATDDPLNNPHPILGDLRVRQAIQFGIDKQFIVDELLFGATTVGSSELNIGPYTCDIPSSPYDPDQAIALLEEAGWVDADGNGVRECDGCMYAEAGTLLRLKLQTTSGNQLREETQQILIEMMKEIGVEFYIENVPSAELFGSWSSGAFRKHGNFDVLMYTTSDGIDPHSQIEGYFASWKIPVEANAGEGFNYSRWVNEVADEAISVAGSTANTAERDAAYQTVCEQADAELPMIYLYDRSEIHLTRARLVGYDLSPWSTQSWNAQEWDIQE
ncbi:MAG: peptide ABC transporter substrate-binding protein [Caldilineaceae bacterium]|nr:peptide ABC transporter substrate-binding protein [Caldilineaceae bacterium]